MSEIPLIHKLSSRESMPESLIIRNKIEYDPFTQKSKYSLDGNTTSCSQGTNGTEPKNEADTVMDDN